MVHPRIVSHGLLSNILQKWFGHETTVHEKPSVRTIAKRTIIFFLQVVERQEQMIKTGKASIALEYHMKWLDHIVPKTLISLPMKVTSRSATILNGFFIFFIPTLAIRLNVHKHSQEPQIITIVTNISYQIQGLL